MTSFSCSAGWLYAGCIAACMSYVVLGIQLKWRRNESFDNLLPVELETTSAVPSRTLRACAAHCLSEQWCNNFFYDDVNKDCLRQRMVFDTVHMTSAPGWRYFKLSSGDPESISDRVSGFHYRLDLTVLNKWDVARNVCLERGEDMAVLEPVVKAQFIRDHFLRNGLALDVLLGVRRPDKQTKLYVWLNGQPMNMTATAGFWVPGTPTFKKSQLTVKIHRKGILWLESFTYLGSKFTLCERLFLLD